MSHSGFQVFQPDAASLRTVLGHFATGVAIVTAVDGEEPVGMACNSFTSVSLEPPLVLFCAAKSSTTWPRIQAGKKWAANILAEDAEEICRLFAQKGTWTGSFGTATGPTEILAMLRKSLGSMPPYDPAKVRSFHLMTNCVIHLDGDRATATSRWTNFGRTEDNKLVPRLAGRYEDVFVRENGKWKFLSRLAPRDIPNPETPAEAGKAP